uniref:DNA helicase n=2 Tax=Octactis speculum TaxID=3111310 RepID=A0A7S2C7K7_9STRA|mmetsp:Transcript_32732/g.44312  ORF Transcript_32732/g.44312 Transcript_32732/m.44312 type:complete len:335 (+) Transcript_32732:3-1007(+)
MMDAHLASCLFKAVAPHTKILLVGDKDQLGSVSAGSVFRDVLAVGEVPRVVLTHIFRQQGDGASEISMSARAVNEGGLPSHIRFALTTPKSRQESRIQVCRDGCVMLQSSYVNDCANIVVATVERLINLGYPAHHIQVLSPVKNGASGTHVLNKRLQRLLNPNARTHDGDGERIMDSRAEQPVYIGDKVIQLVNDYNRSVFNGDGGVVARVLDNGIFDVKFDDAGPIGSPGNQSAYTGLLRYHTRELDVKVGLAYALTVHKAQGSEFPVVVIPMGLFQGRMLQRAFLYTGMSRAKKLLVLVSNKQAIQRAVGNKESRQRLTFLTEHIRRSIQAS